MSLGSGKNRGKLLMVKKKLLVLVKGKLQFLWHHIATHSLSSPITSETVSKKFPGNFQKFPKKLEALLLVAQLGTGNFYRF